jgi:M6 family metalloprotease-like protein
MNNNGWLQDPATREFRLSTRRDFLIRACSTAAVAVGGLVTGIPLTAYTAHAAPTPQQDWRFCGKCNGLFYSGANGCYYRENQRCPAGDRHNPLGYNFLLSYDIEETSTAQKDWRFCTKCHGLFFSGDNGSYHRENQRCPAGELHNPDGYNFVLSHDIEVPPNAQKDWRFCTKCHGLFFSGDNGSYHRENQRCPAGDLHNPDGHNFVLSHQRVFRQLGRATATACLLPPLALTNVGLGLPKPAHRLPSVGYVRTVVLFADFPDVPASQTPQEVFAAISPNAEKFFADISYGRMCWTLEPHLIWLRLSQSSAYYAQGVGTPGQPPDPVRHQEFIQEAVTLADPDVDFSTADSVVVMIPSNATAVGSGPAFGANAGQGYSADGRTFSNGLTSGADMPGWGFRWLNHESGHTMGLPDLYANPSDAATQHRFVGGFGLMGLISGNAPEYFAFERWQLGWLFDRQIVCLESGDETVTLNAIESTGGRKAVIVPRSRSKAVVVESRRRLGYDVNLVKPGALVYVVDTSVASGQGPLVVHPVLENDPFRDRSPLGVGESTTVEDVRITSLSDREDGDVVRIEVAK